MAQKMVKMFKCIRVFLYFLHGRFWNIGVDIKTPIVAHMDGIVRKVSYQDRGAGHFIEVEYPDGSSHVFMHLYQQPNLVVSQRVKGGQVVDLAGAFTLTFCALVTNE